MCKNAHKYDSFIIYNKYTLIHSYTNGGVQLKKTVLEYSTTSPLHVYIDEIDKGENKVVHQMMWQLQTAGIGWMLLLYFSPSLKKKNMTTSSLQSQSSHDGLQSRLCTWISYNLTVHADKYQRAFFFFSRLAKCFVLFFRSFRVTVASRRP